MRPGEAKYTMAATGMIGISGRQVRRILGIMETKLESRRASAGFGGECESAESDQQALGGDSIGKNDANQRAPETPRLYV
jgi:hypothetical protein